MATYQSAAISNEYPVTQPPAGQVAFVRQRVALTANVANGDVLEFFKLPKGAIVRCLRFYGDELDTNGSPTMDIEFGHDDDQNAFGTLTNLDMSAAPLSSGGTYIPVIVQDADDVALTDEKTIKATVTGAAATAASGDVYLEALYTVEVETP